MKRLKKVTKISVNQLNTTVRPKLRVAAYARVSTDSVEQLISLDAQKRHYESYIKSNSEWEFAGIYYDEGITGTKKDKRSGLQQLITDCENKKIDLIITKSISRFARNTMDCLELVRKLTDIDVYIYFEKENINTQSMDSELMLTILSSLAESESLSISENGKWSIQRRFRNGTYKLANTPYGYDYVDGQIMVNQEQARVVKRIFTAALSGKGTQKIANELNAQGLEPIRGKKWTSSTIRGILGNEKYTGDVLLQKTYTDDNFVRRKNKGEKDQFLIQNNHEPIISHEEFEAVQQTIIRRRKEKGIKKGSNKYQNRYPFSSKIKCAKCGSNFKRRTHYSTYQTYIAWSCSKHIKDASKCSMRFIRDEGICQAFILMMNKLIFGHKYILKPLLKNIKAINYSSYHDEIHELESKIEDNAERCQVLTGLMTKGYLDPALFNKQNNELLQELQLLKNQKENLFRTINNGMSKVDEVEKLLKHVSKSKQISSFDEELFARFVERIHVYSQEEIGFELKCGITLKERLVK